MGALEAAVKAEVVMGTLAGLLALGQGSGAEQAYAALVNVEATRQGVDPALVLAVIWAESEFNPQAIGRDPGGTISYGLMQLLLSTAREVAKNPALQPDDLLDPALNVRLGTAYLAWQLRRYGAVPAAVAAYNAGSARRDAAGRFVNSRGNPSVQAYVDRVLSRLAWYKAQPTSEPSSGAALIEAGAFGERVENGTADQGPWPWWAWGALGIGAFMLLVLAGGRR